MLTAETKRKIQSLRDTLVGKIPVPTDQVKQITLGLIYKFMSDIDEENKELGGKSFFTNDYEQYSWNKIVDPSFSGHERVLLYAEGLEKMSLNPHIPQLFRDIFKGAFLPFRDPNVVNQFLKGINEFQYEHSNDLGDAFEYLLQVMGAQGDAGQFVTPRHIIEFIVKAVEPQKTDKILDPACGTAGFLISAYRYILEQNTAKGSARPGSALSTTDRNNLYKNFVGYDISQDMVRISLVNMYLHQFSEPQIFEYDTLSSQDFWEDSFDCILANPPFMTPRGGIRPHKRFMVQANRSEVLFVDYIMEHLNPNGKAGVIVPEGIIFQTANAYKALRKMLVNDGYLYAVVSLPAGVFQPYSGVKTGILLMDKTLAKNAKDILFVKVENDGFDLGAQRRPIDKNDLPKVLEIIWKYKDCLINGKEFKCSAEESRYALVVPKTKVQESSDYNLSGDRYKEVISFTNQKWPMVELGEICEVLDSKRKPVTKADRKQGKYPYYGATGIVDYVNDYIFDEKLVLIGEDGAKWDVGEKTAFIAEGKYWVNNHAHVLRPKKERVLDDYIVPVINSMDLAQYITGVTVPKLNQEKLRSIKIPLPPLEVQKEIVAELDSYQKIIDGAKQVVVSYKPIIKVDPSWKLVNLGEIAGFKRGPFGGSLKKEIFVSNGYKIYEQKNAIKDNFEIGSYFIDEKKYKEMEDFSIKPGDLIVSCSGTMGKVAIVPKSAVPGIINQALLRLTPNTKLVFPAFLRLVLESDSVQKKYFIETSGAAIKNVASVKILKTIPIPLPLLDVQERILIKLDEEKKYIESAKQMINFFEQKIKSKIAEVWES